MLTTFFICKLQGFKSKSHCVIRYKMIAKLNNSSKCGVTNETFTISFFKIVALISKKLLLLKSTSASHCPPCLSVDWIASSGALKKWNSLIPLLAGFHRNGTMPTSSESANACGIKTVAPPFGIMNALCSKHFLRSSA